MIIPILSHQDPRIEAYIGIRERDLVGRQNRFVAEGEVVLRILVGSPYRVESFLISERQANFAEEIRQRVADDVPVYVASQKVMDKIVGFPIHRGLLAMGRRTSTVSAAELLSSLPADALVLGLVGLANHDNIGGIFRNAAAFGVNAVILDSSCCDPLYRKSLRVSVGGALKVPFARVDGTDSMLETFENAGFRIAALSPAGNENLSAFVPEKRTALLFGTEGAGLPEHVLSRVRTVSIAMANSFDSLNVATTCGITLFHMRTVAGEKR